MIETFIPSGNIFRGLFFGAIVLAVYYKYSDQFGGIQK